MQRLKIIMLVGMVCFFCSGALSQVKVPHRFNYQADASKAGILKEVTHVEQPGTSSIRLYFENVRLGPNSYLLLQGGDGARQKLDGEALKNWSNSSAYFNGGTVKLSVYQAAGDSVTFNIREIKVNQVQTSIPIQRKESIEGTTRATSTARIGEFNEEKMPYAAAVGRFTNGSNAYGTGWISPNGAIVTSRTIMLNIAEGYDIIEFNVPLSNNDGSVNHPGPEDQYPVDTKPFYNYDGSALFTFKNSIGYEAGNEPGLAISTYRTDWAVVDVLPNSTGLRPGERQQQYFRVATNPGSYTIEAMDKVEADVLHYGNYPEDIVYPEYTKTLRVTNTKLLSSKEFIKSAWYVGTNDSDLDRESMVIYHDQRDIPFSSSMGAPITYHESNVAIGVHHTFYYYAPAGAIGFNDSFLRNKLNDFFGSNVTYIDADGLYENGATGEVHKPYIRIADGTDQAADEAIVYIAKGSYNESVTINTPMTLKAPVGLVEIGKAGALNARKDTLPRELFVEAEAHNLSGNEEEPENTFDLKSYPNPFASTTEVNYSLSEPTMVRVNVFDKMGNRVSSLVQESQLPGFHSVVWDGNNQNGIQATPGLYVIRIETGFKSTAVRVIKK